MFNRKFKINEKTEEDRERLKELDFSYKDIIAMIIAAYQVLLPYVFGMVAVFFIVLYLFSLVAG
ncbi:MAG TPA: hypothetical protein VLN47_00370 [Clostridiaceae bacterium]|nr:hypothetical protein [Clostridiaceae bacterium]